MPAPDITPLPPAPLRSGTPSTFVALAEAFVDALPGLVTDVNAFGDYLDGLGLDPADVPSAATDLTMATARLLGRVTASTGAVEELTAAQVKTLLAIAAGDVSGVGANLSDLASAATARGNLGLHAVTSQTGTTYTAVLADADSMIRFSNASAITFTIPPNSSVAFPVGSTIEMVQTGAGALSVAAGAGVTVNSRSSDLTLAGQYAVAFVKKVDTDTWIMNGDL